ncbi:MAG: glutamate--cysteine ligase [Pseudomonadota bacterium]
MGQDIDRAQFTDEDHRAFRDSLRQETNTLKRWFDEQAFDISSTFTVGLELEAWLIDRNHLPSPRNDEFFAALDDPDVVAELSRFNVELNAPPHPLEGGVLSQTRTELDATWRKCEQAAAMLDLKPVAIGILPTVRDEMLQPAWMSDANRYRALNAELFRRRGQEPLHVRIEGEDRLDYRCDHIMLEAACTSLQAHLKFNPDDAVRLYNAAVLAAGPLVAATANSPFLYGKSLWAETRIPAFEQATDLDGFRDAAGRNVRRVTLGTGYLRHTFLELFLENLSYPALLPALQADTATLPHLRLQNGTIWRWVRPILGFDGQGAPHLRIEHRVMPAGPSMIDTVANLALCHGLVLSLGQADVPPEHLTPFEDARANFYTCARDGLGADVLWEGKRVSVQSLLLERLIPAAREALDQAGVDAADLDALFADVLVPRIRSGRTGTDWQRSFVDCNGPNLQALTERYIDWQTTGAPVHTWTV